MTAGEAIKMADELRPNNHFENRLKQLWLRQADSGMRRNIVERSQTGGDFEEQGRGYSVGTMGWNMTPRCWPAVRQKRFIPAGWQHRWTWHWARRPGRRMSCSSTRVMCRSLRCG